MLRTKIILPYSLLTCSLLACGSTTSPAPTAMPIAEVESEAPPSCVPTSTLVDFAALQTLNDARKPLHPGDEKEADEEVYSIGLTPGISSWTSKGDQIVADTGCDTDEEVIEEGVVPSCAVVVRILKRQEDGTYVGSGHKTPDFIYPEMSAHTGVEHGFIADLIGDDAPEYWVVTKAEIDEESPDNKIEKLVNVYTIEGFEPLWEVKLKAPDEACAWQLYSSDIDCDGDRDLIGKRACSGTAPEEVQFIWTDGALKAQ